MLPRSDNDNRSSAELKVLAVCTGNICRSPMAEGILQGLFSSANNVSMFSAGTHALEGNPATEFAVIAALEAGIDISGHRARALSREMIQRSWLILCMERFHVEWVLSREPSARGRVYNLADFSGRREMRSIPDPYGCSVREYRECLRNIMFCINNFFSINKKLLESGL